MATFNQLIKGARKNLKKYRKQCIKSPCQMRGLCVEVKCMTPKKPNSAQRKIAKVKLFGPLSLSPSIFWIINSKFFPLFDLQITVSPILNSGDLNEDLNVNDLKSGRFGKGETRFLNSIVVALFNSMNFDLI